MKPLLLIVGLSGALAALLSGCNMHPTQASAPTTFIDMHEFGPGKVTAADVAKAHEADLAVQADHDVRFIEYWVDEARGRVYCLSEAPNAEAVRETHRHAHGLLPTQVAAVASGIPAPRDAGHKTTLYLDVHELGAGKVTAEAVAEAHEKDLAVQDRFAVRFLNYWVDEASGRVYCLSEAPNAQAVRETHRHAHGLLPASVAPVTRGE
jgi:hypothetical protein